MPLVRFLQSVAGTDASGEEYCFAPGEEAVMPVVWADGTRAELVRGEPTETATDVPGQCEPTETASSAQPSRRRKSGR